MSDSASILPLTIDDLRLSLGSIARIDIEHLQITEPGITCVMGFNGAGKSLLLKLVHGLLQPDSGQCLFASCPIDDTLRRSQSMVFQKPVLLRRSVRANVEFVLKSRHLPCNTATVEKLLDSVGLADRSEQAARQLSGGEQQRLALARALATSPSLLLLDEATASLDPASVQLIERAVRLASDQGCKVLLVTHDPGQARRLASEIIFLHEGKLAEQTLTTKFFLRPRSAPARAYLDGRLYVGADEQTSDTRVVQQTMRSPQIGDIT